MFIEIGRNEYGAAVDRYKCETCGDVFTVCPAHEDRSCDDQWAGCLAETCGSYDPSRDADKLFDNGNVVAFGQRAKPDLIVRKPVSGAE